MPITDERDVSLFFSRMYVRIYASCYLSYFGVLIPGSINVMMSNDVACYIIHGRIFIGNDI